MSYFKNVLVSVDQLGNALCGGNPDNTISARVGYFAAVSHSATKYFWKGLEKIINFTFWPVDGPNYCIQAFEDDPEEAFYDNNADVFRALISVFVVAFCVPISAVLYLYWAIRVLVK